MPLLDVVFRSVVIYLFIIIAIRLFGKREISQLSTIDLVFILLISNSVQNAMVGPNTSLWSGVIAAATLFLINKLLDYLIFRSRRVSHFLEGNPILLIYHGRILHDHLQKAGITQDELDQAVREHGVKSHEDVDLAVLEADGNISVLSDDFKHRTSRKRRAHRALNQTS